MKKNKNRDFTKSEGVLLDWAIDTTIEKYLQQGGKKEKMITRGAIDYFFCQMLYEGGKSAVKKFVNEYQYNPRRVRQPVSNVMMSD